MMKAFFQKSDFVDEGVGGPDAAGA